MTAVSPDEKPCLVETRQGFSVVYKERFLYSKYNPSRAIVQTVTTQNFLKGTLILLASPCLWYGLAELLKILPEDCFVAGLEAEAELYEFSKQALEELKAKTKKEDFSLYEKMERVVLLQEKKVQEIHTLFSDSESNKTFPPVYTFKRALMLDFSAGSAFNPELYKNAVYNAQAVIARFWKNRITLVTLGRLFARNIFRNLKIISHGYQLEDFKQSVSKPIVVVGAGESAEKTVQELKKRFHLSKDSESSLPFYILAVDAASGALKKMGIRPDGIVAVESQLAIEKAYIGNTDFSSPLFCDLTSRPSVIRHGKGKLCFETSSYAESRYLKRLEQAGLLPSKIDAMGSVGLTAVSIALVLRKNEDIPVYVTGLDFSYTLGATHMRGAPAHTTRLIKTNRLTPVENYAAAFKTGSLLVQGKNNSVYTDKPLLSYASAFSEHFSSVKNLFDIRCDGLPLNLADGTDSFMNTSTVEIEDTESPREKFCTANKVHTFLEEEKKSLLRIKEILVHGQAVQKKEIPLEEELNTLLEGRDYLYLHFPDGYLCRPKDISFLKRVRSEIDFFLKDMD